MDRSIIHLNVADFAVAVERTVDSRLKRHPVIIAPQGAARAVVYDMSEEAYQAGVRKGMPLRRAVRLSPRARILPPHPDRYERAMGAMRRQVLAYSPAIETGEDDGHLFVDATGTGRLFGPSMDVAWRLRREIKRDLGLEPIWSVAPSKLVAKVATRLVKPSGEYIVASGEEESFLAPLPVSLIPGIEPSDLSRLGELNLTRVFQVTALGPEQLEVPFGPRGRHLYDILRGIDPSPVLPAGEKKPEIVLDRVLEDDTNDLADLESALYTLTERAGAELRRRRLAARRIRIVLDHSDGVRRLRQGLLPSASANDFTLFEAARATLRSAWTRRVRIRHLRLICDRLAFPPAQLSLFPQSEKETERHARLIYAVDRIRERFGWDAVCLGRTGKIFDF
jgi:DNA polymerase-4